MKLSHVSLCKVKLTKQLSEVPSMSDTFSGTIICVLFVCLFCFVSFFVFYLFVSVIADIYIFSFYATILSQF